MHHITNRKISKHLYVRSTMSKTLSQRFVTIRYLLQCLQNCQKSFHKISFLRMLNVYKVITNRMHGISLNFTLCNVYKCIVQHWLLTLFTFCDVLTGIKKQWHQILHLVMSTSLKQSLCIKIRILQCPWCYKTFTPKTHVLQ